LARLVTLALDEDKPNMVNDKQNGAMLTLGQGLPLLTPVAMRAVEDAAIAAGIPALCLMERAAAAAVSAILRFAPGLPTLVLCGPGNNGGDGYAIACGLRALGLPVRVAAGGAATGEPAATMARSSHWKPQSLLRSSSTRCLALGFPGHCQQISRRPSNACAAVAWLSPSISPAASLAPTARHSVRHWWLT
jgi:hypothetical protein